MRILLLFLFVTSSVCSNAQSIDKRYSSYLSEKGMLYYFSAKKLGKKTNTQHFEYDMTYVKSEDSLTLNYTLTTLKPCNVKLTKIKINGEEYKSGSSKTLYRDIKNNYYILRTSTKFAFTDIDKAFMSETPLVFEMVYDNDNKASATYSKSQWKKEQSLITRIINSIKL